MRQKRTTSKHIFLRMISVLMSILMIAIMAISCQGPQGHQGEKGETGEQGEKGDPGAVGATGAPGLDGKDGVDGKDGADGKAGADGKDGLNGKDGIDGLTPSIGDNGNWWIGDVDTGVRAEGLDGEDGQDGKDGKDGLNGSKGKDGKDGEDGEDGEDGLTPYVGPNGNWWIGNKDTGVCAEALDGKDGKDGEDGEDGKDGLTPYVGPNGNWWIGNKDIGVRAEGVDGQDGKDGEKGEKGDPGVAGADGKTTVFRVHNGWLQWKYVNDTFWTNLYEINGTPAPEGLVRVRYSVGGGKLPNGVPSQVDVTVGTSIYLPTPEYDGYAFDGWYISGEEYPVTSPYRVHQSITLTAKWVPGAKVTGTKIYTMSDLAKIKNNLEGTYVLMNDIDCGGLALPPIGTDKANAFRGLFDGQGYTISNFVASPGQYNGLFGYNAGTIRNLNVADFSMRMEQSNTNGYVCVGGLVGFNAGNIEQCTAQNGDIYVKLTNNRAAGLIAGASNGTIENCYATGSVYVNQPSGSSANANAGGIVGENEGGRIENCLVNASVSAHGGNHGGTGRAALISATNEGSGQILNCIVLGSVTAGNSTRGDICGPSEGSIKNCYKDENLTLNNPTNTYATPMSKTQLSNPNCYEITLEWDPTIWNLTNINLENGRYPTLNQK